MIRLLAPACLGLLLGTVVCAQPLPEDVLFDDFDYASAEWTPTLHGSGETEGAESSLYGPNEWTVSTNGDTEWHRLWYRHQWQESGYVPERWTLEPSPNGVEFGIDPGAQTAGGCPDPADPERRNASVQQIATGFAARRGTWAARVRFDDLGDNRRASFIQAFWLLGPAAALIEADGRTVRVTNEVDHEWNNRFLGYEQPFPFVATGAYLADSVRDATTPLAAPGLALEARRRGPQPREGLGSCRYTGPGGPRQLPGEACSALLLGRSPGGSIRAPRGEVYATLLLTVADSGIHYDLVSDGWGGRIEMTSRPIIPSTQQPLFAIFSQHVFPGQIGSGCGGLADVDRRRTFGVDWFLYSPDIALDADAASALVREIRARGISRLATIPDARIERPVRPLSGMAARFGRASLTSPLTIRLQAPRAMQPGETTEILALPPERHGLFRYTWTLATRYDDGRYEVSPVRTDAFSLPLTFPDGARNVLIRVRLEEIDTEQDVIRNGIVRPTERLFMIRRAPAP